jgi:hypothetical protein
MWMCIDVYELADQFEYGILEVELRAAANG